MIPKLNAEHQIGTRIGVPFILIVLLLATMPVMGQLYFTNTNAPSWENTLIYRVEADFSYDTIVTLNHQVGDIAITPDGQMYGIKASELFEINLETGELTSIAVLPFGDYSYSLVSSHDYHLYTLALSGILYAYDLQKDSLELIDYLGVFGKDAGDITFYGGNIIVQGYNNADFYAYNLQDKDITRVLCKLGNGDDMNAIGNRIDSCGQEMVYGITSRGSVYEFDFENNTINLLHNYGSLNFSGYGMATTSEHMAAQCYFHMTGEDCNTVSATNANQEEDVLLYPNPADDVLFLKSELDIESIYVYSSTGKLVKTFKYPTTSISINDITSGVYLFTIYSEGNYWNQIVVIR